MPLRGTSARWRVAAVCAMAAAAAIAGCEPGAGRRDSPPRRAARIVSLAPSVTEMVFALGAGPQVVGVSQYCDYPPEVLKLPKVGTFLTPNIEAIAALRPTLVIGLATSSDLREIRALDAMGYATLMVNDGSIARIEESIGAIAERIDRGAAARQLLDGLHLQVRSVEQRLRGAPDRRVLMVVGHQPMVAVGRGTFLDELIALAHARNIAAASAQPWPRLSLEYIIAMRPEVILDGQMGTDAAAPSNFWARYSSIPAVADKRVSGYAQDPMLHPGPRIGQSLEMLAHLIHPEAFGASGKNAERFQPATVEHPGTPEIER